MNAFFVKMSLMSVKMPSVGGGIDVVIYLSPFHRLSIFLCESWIDWFVDLGSRSECGGLCCFVERKSLVYLSI